MQTETSMMCKCSKTVNVSRTQSPKASRFARLPTRQSMATFLRSTLAGAVATLSDLVVLGVLISCTGLSARIASVPALLAGGIVNFYSNRHFAFRAKSGSLARQASLFTLVEIITLVLNGILFDYAAKAFHPNAAQALLMRLVISNVVFVCWSYPLWKRIFEQPQHVKTA